MLKNVSIVDLRVIYELLFNTGIRISECLNLTWNEINFNERSLKVTNKKESTTKNKKERIITMNNTVLELLRFRLQSKKIFRLQDEYIFQKVVGARFSLDYISTSFKKSVRKIELDDRIHLHSFCSNLVSKGVSLYLVRELAGH